jgi:hypothetical protein
MPPTTAKPMHLSKMPVSRPHWSLSILRSRYITDGPGLSSQAKIGLISAGAIICVLLLLILAWYLARCSRELVVESSGTPPFTSLESRPAWNRDHMTVHGSRARSGSLRFELGQYRRPSSLPESSKSLIQIKSCSNKRVSLINVIRSVLLV